MAGMTAHSFYTKSDLPNKQVIVSLPNNSNNINSNSTGSKDVHTSNMNRRVSKYVGNAVDSKADDINLLGKSSEIVYYQ